MENNIYQDNSNISYSGGIDILGYRLSIPEGVFLVKRQEMFKSVKVYSVFISLNTGLHLID